MENQTPAKLSNYWRASIEAEKTILQYAGGWTKKINRQRYSFLIQILISTFCAANSDDKRIIRYNNHIYIPLPYDIKKQIGPHAVLEAMHADGLVKIYKWSYTDKIKNWYSKKDNLCCRVSLNPQIISDFIHANLSALSRSDDRSISWRNIVDRTFLKNRRLPDNFASEYDGEIVEGPEIEIPIKAMLEKCRELLLQAEGNCDLDKRQRALRCYSTVSAILNSPTFRRIKNKKGFAIFKQNYKLGNNGRNYGVSANLQNAPKELKQVLIDAGSFKNFDLKSCHTNALSALAGAINQSSYIRGEYAPIPHTDELKHLAKNGINEIAEELGVDKSIVKQANHRAMMGGSIKNKTVMSVLMLLEKCWHGARKLANKIETELSNILELKNKIIRELEKIVESLGRYRGNKKLNRMITIINTSGGVKAINAAGGEMVVLKDGEYVDKNKNGNVMKKKTLHRLLSHILVGIERDFIRRIISQIKFDMPFLDEHDGLATLGEIPGGIIKEAQRDSVFNNSAQLVAKSFC